MKTRLEEQVWQSEEARLAVQLHNERCNIVADLEAKTDDLRKRALESTDASESLDYIHRYLSTRLDTLNAEIYTWTQMQSDISPKMSLGWDEALQKAVAKGEAAYAKRAKAAEKLGLRKRSDGRYPDSGKSQDERDADAEIQDLKVNRKAVQGPDNNWIKARLEYLRAEHRDLCLKLMGA